MTRFVFLLLMISAGCADSNNETVAVDVKHIDLHLSNQSQTPNLYVLEDTIYMVWTDEDADTTKLYFSKRWDENELLRTEVASGVDWFVNWADFSSIMVDPNNPNNVITHWLEKRSEGTYDYDIKISISHNGGKSWSPAKTLHSDGIAAEHGFVSMTNYDDDHFYASWLDGRNTKTPNPVDTSKHLPMTIRGGLINKQTLSIQEYEIDKKVCDCCQTASVQTANGVLTTYRDRTDNEIRDLTVQRFNGATYEQRYKSNDNWKINGCPVNGPALAADSQRSAMAWYTAADSASVWLAYGENDQFQNKVKIDNGNPLGRVDIEMDESNIYVSWLEMKDQRAEIRIKTIDISHHRILTNRLIALTSPERRSGFPIMKISEDYLYIAHTEVLSADETTVRLKRIEK